MPLWENKVLSNILPETRFCIKVFNSFCCYCCGEHAEVYWKRGVYPSIPGGRHYFNVVKELNIIKDVNPNKNSRGREI